MWDFTGEIKDLTLDFRTGAAVLSLLVNEKTDVTECFDELNGKKISVRIGKHRKKRSLDANGYFWVLCDKLAMATGAKKEDIYRREIKFIGGNSEVVCVRAEAADKLRSGWEHNGIGWVTDVTPSKIDGCVNVILYYGSSTYDTVQMSRLIDSLIEECKAQGIQVITPDEIAEMMSRWSEYEERYTKR